MFVQKEVFDVMLDYRACGDERPIRSRLRNFSNILEEHVGEDSIGYLAHADVLIDLSVADPYRADIHLENAQGRLDDLISTFNHEPLDMDNVITAHGRKAQLHMWAQTTSRENAAVEADYDILLHGASEAVDVHDSYPDQTTRGALRELLPVVLSARSEHKSLRWMARSALLREDFRYLGEHRLAGEREFSNANWDIGYSSQMSSQGFLSPETKIQVKALLSSKEVKKYSRAGVLCMFAVAHGFAEPADVLQVCFADRMLKSQGQSQNIYGSVLDDMTKSMVTFFRDPNLWVEKYLEARKAGLTSDGNDENAALATKAKTVLLA